MKRKKSQHTCKLLVSAHKYKQLIAQNDELKYNDEVSEIKFIIRFLLSISLCLAKSNALESDIFNCWKCISIHQAFCVCLRLVVHWTDVSHADFIYSNRTESLFRWRELYSATGKWSNSNEVRQRELQKKTKKKKKKNTKKNQIKRNWNEWYTQITSIENDQLRESLIQFFFPFYSLDSKILYHSHINVQLFRFDLVVCFFFSTHRRFVWQSKSHFENQNGGNISIFLSHLTSPNANARQTNSVNGGMSVKCSAL